MKKKVLYISIIGVLLLIGVSYAIWQMNFTQESSNVVSAACFNITYTDQDNINLENTYPMLDSEGATLTPYQFTITNNCSEYASYQVNLEVLNTTTLNSQFVKIKFGEETPKLLTNYASVATTLANASSAYKMIQGFLQPNESKTYTLKLWIDENVTLADNIENKLFASKVTIASAYKAEAPTVQEECELTYGEGAAVCNIIASADPTNSKCLQFNEDGSIKNPTSTMSDSDTPIICTMEDNYGTSYYLRGNHQDNNVKFANMCWKLVRVTGTGGLKLIYNGDLDENGKCESPIISEILSPYNLDSRNYSLSYAGYMYDNIYLVHDKGSSTSDYYGSSFEYNADSSRPYTLNDAVQQSSLKQSADSNHHYTCFNTTDNTCDKLYFVVYIRNSILYYIELVGNERIDDAIDKMIGNNNMNTQNSNIKTAVDSWYETKIKNTPNESKLEDTIFCNERKVFNYAGWSETGIINSLEKLEFNTGREKYYPKCLSKANSYTVSDTVNGNGALTYPIGIATATEMVLLGNNTARKYGTSSYWLASPDYYDEGEGIIMNYINSNGVLTSDYGFAYSKNAIRPMLSLKPTTQFKAGTDGTASNPYEVE